jgi:hypothetical protein
MMSHNCCATTSRVSVCVSGIVPPANRAIILGGSEICQQIPGRRVRAE